MTTDAVETKIISMLDALQNGAVEVAGQVVKYAPDVVNAALQITRVDGVQNILNGVIFTLISLGLWFVFFKCLKTTTDRDFSEPAVFGCVTTCIGGSITTIVSIIYITDIWSWIQIFEPKLYIAHQIVEKVMK